MKGFTLIEVLLSLALFTIIGMATVKHIQQIQNTKTMAFNDLDFYNDVRATISLLRFDLSQAFHVQYDDLGDENKALVVQNQPAPHTLFDGRKNELVFTSLSHRVYYTDRKESEQAEISYFLQNRKGSNFSTLMKRESGLIDSDLYQGGTFYTLLDNVVSLQFQYWDEKQKKWVDDWNSDNGTTRDKFPYAVKMKIGLGGRGSKPFNVEAQFKISFPNNDSVLVQF